MHTQTTTLAMGKLSVLFLLMSGTALLLGPQTVEAKPFLLLPANFFRLTTRAPANGGPANRDNTASVQIPDFITPKLLFLTSLLQGANRYKGIGGGSSASSGSSSVSGSVSGGFGFGFGLKKFQPTTTRRTTTTSKPELTTEVNTQFKPESTEAVTRPTTTSTTTERSTTNEDKESLGTTVRPVVPEATEKPGIPVTYEPCFPSTDMSMAAHFVPGCTETVTKPTTSSTTTTENTSTAVSSSTDKFNGYPVNTIRPGAPATTQIPIVVVTGEIPTVSTTGIAATEDTTQKSGYEYTSSSTTRTTYTTATTTPDTGYEYTTSSTAPSTGCDDSTCIVPTPSPSEPSKPHGYTYSTPNGAENNEVLEGGENPRIIY